MAFVEGFAIPVRAHMRDEFTRYSRELDEIFLAHGATRVVECWGVNVPYGQQTDFYRAVAAEEDEVVCFSWIEWPDRETSERAHPEMIKIMESDPRFDRETRPIPFDGKRMIFGRFETVVDIRS
jgi:uncharacterized protein YbaA (DUF1428 family)